MNFAVGLEPSSVAIGDFNGDGKLDLAVANGAGQGEGNNVSILLGDGTGSFGPATNFIVGFWPGLCSGWGSQWRRQAGLAVGIRGGADFTGEGVSILLGNGDGSFVVAPTFAVGSGPSSVAVGDFNGDASPTSPWRMGTPSRFYSATAPVLRTRQEHNHGG